MSNADDRVRTPLSTLVLRRDRRTTGMPEPMEMSVVPVTGASITFCNQPNTHDNDEPPPPQITPPRRRRHHLVSLNRPLSLWTRYFRQSVQSHSSACSRRLIFPISRNGNVTARRPAAATVDHAELHPTYADLMCVNTAAVAGAGDGSSGGKKRRMEPPS